jgi:phosphoglycerate kinase
MQVRKRNVSDVLETLNANRGDVAPKVLVRVDFNVPMNAAGEITDDSRIRGAIPTIETIVRSKCNAILVSHMGRPKLVQAGGSDEDTLKERQELSLKPAADRLASLMGMSVIFGEDCMGDKATSAIAELPAEGGGIVLLENLRFYKKEEKNDQEFSAALASYADGYVNDAFGTCHRAHGSTAGVPNLMDPKVCGIGSLVASELNYLDFSALPEGETVAAIIGGSKVSTKLPVIQGLLKSVDTLILGGGLAFTFLKAQGVPVGNSLVEEGMVETALDLIQQANDTGKTLVIPVDAVCAQSFPKGPMSKDETKTFDLTPETGIEDGWMGLDVGPKTVARFEEVLSGINKIVFNGPMGVFEVTPFDEGTRGLVDVLVDVTQRGSITVVGGGDSVAALEAFGKTGDVSYVSTGGGAALELLAGDKLPGVEAIENIH